MPEHSLIFVREGKLLVRGREETFEVPAGSYIFIQRDCSLSIQKMTIDGLPYQGINFLFPRNRLRKYFKSLEKKKNHSDFKTILDKKVIYLPKTAPLQSLFNSFLAYSSENRTPSLNWIELKFAEAINALLEVDERFSPILFNFDSSWKTDLLEFMEENFAEDLTLSEFASYSGRSLSTFKRDFAKVSELSPEKWLINRRLEFAKELLRETQLTAVEIGYRAGFKNRAHFFRVFKERFGLTPKEFSLEHASKRSIVEI